MKVKLVLEEEFEDKAIKHLLKLPGAPPMLRKGSDEEFQFGLELIKKVAEPFGLELGDANSFTRIVELRGPLAAIGTFFNVELGYFEHKISKKNCEEINTILGHLGHSSVPLPLAGIVHSVIGIKNVPMSPMAAKAVKRTVPKSFAAANGKTSAWMSQYYKFPKETTGAGQHIGIITCGGGFSQEEFDEFFDRVGMRGRPPIKVVSVGKVKNTPGISWLYDYEIATDCLVAACAAPGAKISVYFCENNMNGFMDALQTINAETDGPDIISYSWGIGEDNVDHEIVGVNRILKETAIRYKKTIFCSSGDYGSTNNPSGHKERDELTVQFPASSQWVTSCGGTMFYNDPKTNALKEKVWNSLFLYGAMVRNASGGGFSLSISRPDYQKPVVPDLIPSGYINEEWADGAKGKKNQRAAIVNYFKPYRGIPDVAGHACVAPEGLGYWIYFQKTNWLSGGTSAVAPLWAALTAHLNEGLEQKIGFFNPYLYEMAGTSCFNEILEGNNAMIPENSHWVAGTPWNPCTGLGTPNGKKILEWMKKKMGSTKAKKN